MKVKYIVPRLLDSLISQEKRKCVFTLTMSLILSRRKNNTYRDIHRTSDEIISKIKTFEL